ncbi:kinase-like protein [Ceratobasidium sp. AG-I]|nr:kinase-like protein [Ceratobasidium sp. AG-I]
MGKLFQARNIEANPYAQTSRFVEMLTATVGRGAGECTSEDLFEIWATRPDSDRHLRAFYWYLDGDTGLDYIILHVVATLDFKTDQRWWVRLERDEGIDKVYISRSRDLILLRNSELTSQMTFQDGVPFEDVRDILEAAPVAGPAAADSWDYASQLAFKLSVNVGNGLGDCPTKDLCQMWSGDYGRNVAINRAQCYREDGEDEAEYMLLNVSERSQGWGRSGLWLRLEQNATSGTNLDWTSISQNRRRLLSRGASLVADMAFDELTFGEVRTIISRRQSNSFQGKIPSHSSMAEMLSSFSSLSCSAKSMQAMTPVITSTMPMSEVITHLVAHGCKNISNTLNVPRCASLPVSRGGFGEVYKGYLRNGDLVALKCVKISVVWGDEEDQKALKNAARELYAWSKCSPHENIAPLLGLAVFRNQLTMISPWMDNGTLNNLDKFNMNVDRCRLSAQVCRGLAHLHLQNIVHGDMKGANILLSNNGTAMITDFGNTVLGECALRFTQASSKPHFSSRWAAPEVLENKVQCSKEADVFALGMTLLEIISGRPPYANIKGDAAVIYAIVDKKEIPKRPTRIPSESKKGDLLWSLLQECWAFNPRNRPGAAKVEEVMRNIKQSDLA